MLLTTDPARRARRKPGVWGMVIVLLFLAYWALAANLDPETRQDGTRYLIQWPIDFQVYYEAAANMSMGRNLYEANWIGILPFTYPPFAAVFMQLLVWTDFETAGIVWQISSAFVLFAVIVACFRQRGYVWSTRLLVLGGIAFFASFNLVSIQGTFFFGQINIFLLGLIAWDFLGKRGAKYRGVGTGLAAGLKLTPAFHGVLFLVERKWWAAVLSFGVFLLTVGIGFVFVPDASSFWTGKITDTERIGQEQNPGALCLKAMMIRREWPLETVLWIFGVAVVLYLFYLGARGAIRTNNYVMAIGLSGTTAALVSPFSWYHHWVYSVPLVIALMDGLRRIFAEKLAQYLEGQVLWWLQELGGLLAGVLVVIVFLPQAAAASVESMNFMQLTESGNWFVQELHIYSSLLLMAAIAIYYSRTLRRQNAS
ncbi:MAG: glycosyltransferase 87 family protein [Corynebacterium sp.]|nr:glycosyltransferase 87 family protein [Corynebacterium sp.]